MSFPCPICPGVATTLHSRRRKGFVKRRYQCVACGARFTSHEILVDARRGKSGPGQPILNNIDRAVDRVETAENMIQRRRTASPERALFEINRARTT